MLTRGKKAAMGLSLWLLGSNRALSWFVQALVEDPWLDPQCDVSLITPPSKNTHARNAGVIATIWRNLLCKSQGKVNQKNVRNPNHTYFSIKYLN